MSIKGFNNQKGFGTANFVTVQGTGSDKQGIPSAISLLKDVSNSLSISSVSQSIDGKEINITFSSVHSARKGDVVKMMSGGIIDWEFEIVEIVSTTILKIWNTAPSLPAASQLAKVCRWVTANSDSSGRLLTSDSISTVGRIERDYSNSSVSTSWAELTASSPLVSKIQVFDSSGSILYLGIGASGSEVISLVIIPGGNGYIDFKIPAGSRVSIRTASGSVSAGNLIINLFG
jgi:hypothetical protein